MFLRWMVNSYLRQTAQRKLYQVVGEAMGGRRVETGERRRAENRSTDAGEAGEGSESDAPPPPPCSAALVFGSDLEAGGFVDTLKNSQATRCASYVEFDGLRRDRRVVVVETGIGVEAARRGADDAIDYLQPQWVVSAGFAGALDDSLKRGHFLMANSVVNEAGEELSIGLRMDESAIRSTPGLHVGRLLTLDRLVREERQRRELASRHGAVACDMETMAVAQVCRERRVRFMSVRVISDPVDHKLNRETELLLDQNSLAGKLGVVAATLLQRPSAVKDLWNMREEAIALSDRLARFLGGVVDQLS